MSTTQQQQRGTQVAEDRGNDFRELLDRQMVTRPELLQMRMENETIMAECRAAPRLLADCKAKLDDLLNAFPEFAETAVYRRPVGKDDFGNEKFAEGLSIRAAEALAEAYGYNRVRGDVTRIDHNTVKIDATFTDFATGRIWQDGRLVSQMATRAKDKGGGQYRIDDQRFMDTVVGAQKSKVIREVICRTVSPALKAWFETRCREIVCELLTDEKIAEIFRKFGKRGIDEATVEKLVGRPRSMGWTNEDKVALNGIFSALKNNETTVEELLKAANGDDQKPTTTSGEKPKTLEDVTRAMGEKRTPTQQQSQTDLGGPHDIASVPSEPLPQAWDVYVKAIAGAKTSAEVTAIYDKAFGPDSTVEWTLDEAKQGADTATARKEQLAKESPRKAPKRDASSPSGAGESKQ